MDRRSWGCRGGSLGVGRSQAGAWERGHDKGDSFSPQPEAQVNSFAVAVGFGLNETEKSKAFFGDFGFADGAAGVVDEVIDLVEAAGEHGVTVDDDIVELGVGHGAGEGGEAGRLVANALDDELDPGAGVRLLAGDAAAGGLFGGAFFGHGAATGNAEFRMQNSERIVQFHVNCWKAHCKAECGSF
jgi:hypothetical protein